MPNTALVKKLILDQCRVPRRDRVYSIGPYATRVSFASQQQRALNLIWALDDDIDGGGMRLESRRVAVVGGGVAGTTAAIGFLARGAGVTLFERAKTVLHVQQDAGHRQIHPTVNVWPATRLDPTAPLPFMHWHEGRADKIVAALRGSWRQYEAYVNVQVSREVVGVADGPHGVRLLVRDPANPDAPGELTPDLFHVVVFATGFGEEIVCAGGKPLSYWTEKRGHSLAKRLKSLGANAHVTIGGTGDGGLIDTLRVLCGSHFNAGGLSADLIKAVHGLNDMRIEIRHEEAQLQAHWLNANETTKNEFSQKLESVYEGAVRRNIGVLDRKIRFDALPADMRVTLYGEFAAPYTSLSAPIHKLMIAYARNKGKLAYVHARVEHHDDKAKALTIVEPLPDKLFPEKAAQIPIVVRSDLHISRQGSRPPLGEIFGPNDAGLLRLQQSHIGNYIFAGLYDPTFFKTEPSFCEGNPIVRFGPTSLPYVEDRKRNVSELLSTFMSKPNLKIERADPVNGEPAWRYALLRNKPGEDTAFHIYMSGNEPKPYRLYDVEILMRDPHDEPVVDLIT